MEINLQGSHQVLLDSYCDEQNTLKVPKIPKERIWKALCQSAQDLGSPGKSLNQMTKNQMISDVTALTQVGMSVRDVSRFSLMQPLEKNYMMEGIWSG